MGAACVEGALRAASAALWTNGSFEVALRLSQPAVSSADAEQLGLGNPQFMDMPLGPASWRKAGVCTEILLAAASVDALMSSRGLPSADSLFQGAAGVVVDEVLYTICGNEPVTVAGNACAYRLRVQAPQWV